jgi:type II secretory pathway component GspD/PulD (secretin)
MKHILSTVIVLLFVFLLPAKLAADIDFGNSPTADLWRLLMEKEYALDVVDTPAIDVCKFFSKTTGFAFVCSEDLSRERITVQMQAPFGKIFETFLEQLHAECYFGTSFAFVAKPDDPGLGKYPQTENLPEKMYEIISFQFQGETLAGVTEFMKAETGVPVEFSPRLRSERVTMSVPDIPFIDSMECIARYLKAPMRVENGKVHIGES